MKSIFCKISLHKSVYPLQFSESLHTDPKAGFFGGGICTIKSGEKFKIRLKHENNAVKQEMGSEIQEVQLWRQGAKQSTGGF